MRDARRRLPKRFSCNKSTNEYYIARPSAVASTRFNQPTPSAHPIQSRTHHRHTTSTKSAVHTARRLSMRGVVRSIPYSMFQPVVRLSFHTLTRTQHQRQPPRASRMAAICPIPLPAEQSTICSPNRHKYAVEDDLACAVSHLSVCSFFDVQLWGQPARGAITRRQKRLRSLQQRR